MILPLILLALPHESTVGVGPEKVLLQYKFETGDKYVMRNHLVLYETSTGYGPTPTHSVVDYTWDRTMVVDQKNVDESADVDEGVVGKKLVDGKPEDFDASVKDLKYACDPFGRQTHVQGWHVHASDQIMPTSFFTELPDEPVGIGAKWRTDIFDYPAGRSAAICTVKAIRHEKGHTLVDLLDYVSTFETKTTVERSDVNHVPTPCKGVALVLFVFDATEGRFLSGEGVGNMMSEYDGNVNGQKKHFKIVSKSTFKSTCVKHL